MLKYLIQLDVKEGEGTSLAVPASLCECVVLINGIIACLNVFLHAFVYFLALKQETG